MLKFSSELIEKRGIGGRALRRTHCVAIVLHHPGQKKDVGALQDSEDLNPGVPVDFSEGTPDHDGDRLSTPIAT